MKKIFTTTGLLFFAFAIHATAQDTIKISSPQIPVVMQQDAPRAKAPLPPAGYFHRVEFGVRFMPTLSSFVMETSTGGHISGEVTLGYGVGGVVGFNITNHVGVQGEIIYNSLSQKYQDATADREINVRYVNIPLLLSINTDKSKMVNVNVVVGPQLGYNVGSSINSTSGSSDTLKTVLTTKRNDIGFAYGVGLEYCVNPTRTMRLDFGYRGVYGFGNISNTASTPSALTNDWRLPLVGGGSNEWSLYFTGQTTMANGGNRVNTGIGYNCGTTLGAKLDVLNNTAPLAGFNFTDLFAGRFINTGSYSVTNGFDIFEEGIKEVLKRRD